MKTLKEKWQLYLFFALAVALLCEGCLATLRPPRPEITYGEFPIRVTCEVNGEEIIVEDTVICEFDGYSWTGGGVYRQWKSSLASGREEILLLAIDESTELSCTGDTPEYYMDDLESVNRTREGYEKLRENLFEGYFISLRKKTDNGYVSNGLSAKEALEKYGFRVISVEYSEPIENTFPEHRPLPF